MWKASRGWSGEVEDEVFAAVEDGKWVEMGMENGG